MNRKKLLNIFLIAIAILCLAAGIVLLVLAGQHAGYRKGLYIVVGVILLLLSALIVLYWTISRKEGQNFFLYDVQEERNLPVESLTRETVLERMTYFISQLADSPEMLWSGNVLEWNGSFGRVPPSYSYAWGCLSWRATV